MTSRVIETDTHVWVAGVSWLTFASRPPTKDLLELARESHSGYVALRSAGAFQVGFSQLDKLPKNSGKNKKPVLCLGPAISMSHSAPWRGIFDLGDGQFWYIAVRDNFAITVDGDVVGERALIDRIADSHAFYDDWNEVEGTLEDVLGFATAPEAPQVLLARAKGGPSRAVALGAGAVVVASLLALGGVKVFEHWRARRDAEHALIAQARAKALLKLQASDHDRAQTVSIIDPQVMLSSCAQKMLNVPTVYQGWTLQRISCRPSQITLTWHEEDGANNKFVQPGQFFDAKSRTLRAFYNIQNVQSTSLKKDPARARQEYAALSARLQGASFTLKDRIEFAPENDAQPAGSIAAATSSGTSSKPPMPTVHPSGAHQVQARGKTGVASDKDSESSTVAQQAEYDFTITGQIAPDMAQAMVKGLKGLTLESVEWVPSSGWWYAGRIQ
jgi:hypothetical protein